MSAVDIERHRESLPSFAVIRDDLESVEARLHEVVPEGLGAVSAAVRYILQAGGKRLRPALVLLSARACGYAGEDAVLFATAAELLHTASLVHDDLLHGSALRRGLPTINTKWDGQVSLLAGEHFYLEMACILAQRRGSAIPDVLVSTATRMFRGEALQIVMNGRMDLSEETYLRIIEQKSALFLSACCQVGAMLNGTAAEIEQGLKTYGLSLGMAFQIRDDVLDLIAEQGVLGKSVGDDLAEGRFTLPVIHFLNNGAGHDRDRVVKVLSSRRSGKEKASKIVPLLKTHGAIEYAERKARLYAEEARRSLAALPRSEAKQVLEDLCGFVVERTS